ncbi:hypothetical protein C8R43DRAFT_1137161 [Mycena crocata]|nr:hypothetical protein C8R43DRAFT_1137161 [Mycena crocata]
MPVPTFHVASHQTHRVWPNPLYLHDGECVEGSDLQKGEQCLAFDHYFYFVPILWDTTQEEEDDDEIPALIPASRFAVLPIGPLHAEPDRDIDALISQQHIIEDWILCASDKIRHELHQRWVLRRGSLPPMPIPSGQLSGENLALLSLEIRVIMESGAWHDRRRTKCACGNGSPYHCVDCTEANLCQDCMIAAHVKLPFHEVLEWNDTGGFFMRSDLRELGLRSKRSQLWASAQWRSTSAPALRLGDRVLGSLDLLIAGSDSSSSDSDRESSDGEASEVSEAEEPDCTSDAELKLPTTNMPAVCDSPPRRAERHRHGARSPINSRSPGRARYNPLVLDSNGNIVRPGAGNLNPLNMDARGRVFHPEMPLVIRSAGGGTMFTETATQPERLIMARRSTGGRAALHRAAAAHRAAGAVDAPDAAAVVPAVAAVPVVEEVPAPLPLPVADANEPPPPAAEEEPRPQINHSVWRSGSRVHTEPRWEERVWLTEDRPRDDVICIDENHECSICTGIKTFPVTVWCGHSYCYECARRYLKKSWRCPECRGVAYGTPIRQYAEERGLRKAYPDYLGKSVVSYSWAGLQFPAPKNSRFMLASQ